MRRAFLITPTYSQRSEIIDHPTAVHDRAVLCERLVEPGYDFDVEVLPTGCEPDVWLNERLSEGSVGAEDALLLYVSAVSHLNEAGEISIELDGTSGGLSRLPLSRLRFALSAQGIQSAAVVLDLINEGDASAVVLTEHVAAARRVFAPELSGYSLLCALRSSERADAMTVGVAPFTSLWLKAVANEESRNKVGVGLVSRVMDVMRNDPDLYTDVSCFSMIPGRRDLKIYSATSASLAMSLPPPPPSSGMPPSMRPAVQIDDVFWEGDELLNAGDADAASRAYKKVLLLCDEKSSQRAKAYVKIAGIKGTQACYREAALFYRKALAIEPEHVGALGQLADVLRAEGDFVEAAAFRSKLLSLVEEDETRFSVLLALADDNEKAKKLSATIEALEEARGIRSDDAAVLARLEQVYDADEQPNKVVDIKVGVASLKSQPEEMARCLVLAGDFAAERAKDTERAIKIYEEALEKDPLTPRAFDGIVQHWLTCGDLRTLEKALLSQTVRLDKAGAHTAEAEVWRTLASLRKESLDDLRGAIEALDRCVERLPKDVETRVALAEMLHEANEVEAAIMCLEIAAWHAPGRHETYRFLHKLLLKVGRIDQAYSCAAALVLLNKADLDEELFYSQYHSDTRVSPTQSLDRLAWKKLFPLGQDPNVGAILDIVAPSAIDLKLQWLQAQAMLPELDPETRQDPETSTVSLTRTFVWASTVLDVPLPEIYIGDDVPGGIAAVPAQVPTALVGTSVLSGRSLKELGFLVGRDITYFRPAHYILILYSSLKDLTSLFLASVAIVRPNQTIPAGSKREINAMTKFLAKSLSDKARDRLEAAVHRFEANAVRADLVGWARSIEVAGTRAGFLLCGDIQVVSEILADDDRSIANLSAQDRMHDLLPFSVSETYANLRRDLGIAVG